ncbi:phosphopantothenoylcysteine decarboxylase domain-containing protein, partial [Enterococcus gallinarum]
MRILITAGGTSEKIDSVRSITNHSTGSLGKAI